LLSVSNAALLSVPNNLVDDWYGPYLTKKESVMFEYHDCKNTNALPMVDVVFARDVISLLDESAQQTVINDFMEKLKGNGIVILGENEAMPSAINFGEKTVNMIVAYTKD